MIFVNAKRTINVNCISALAGNMFFPTGRRFLLKGNSLNLNSANHLIFRNLPMIDYIIVIKKLNSLIFSSVKLTNLSKVA